MRVARELEDSFNETITPAQAEQEGLGDAETVARKLRTGRLKNHGRKFNPVVRRGDLLGLTTGSALPLVIERRALRSRNDVD